MHEIYLVVFSFIPIFGSRILVDKRVQAVWRKRILIA